MVRGGATFREQRKRLSVKENNEGMFRWGCAIIKVIIPNQVV